VLTWLQSHRHIREKLTGHLLSRLLATLAGISEHGELNLLLVWEMKSVVRNGAEEQSCTSIRRTNKSLVALVLDSREVHEHIVGTVVGSNETETLLAVEELHSAGDSLGGEQSLGGEVGLLADLSDSSKDRASEHIDG
jgi:hypothetical protein